MYSGIDAYCMYACGDYRSTVDLTPQALPTLFSETVLSRGPEACQLGLLGSPSEPQRSNCLYVSSIEIQTHHHNPS